MEFVEFAGLMQKHVEAVKQAENAERLSASKKAEEKKRLLAILADKEDEALNGMSLDEIKKKIEELG